MDTLIKAVERFISGDWGEENYSPESSEEVVCIRGADIENVQGGIYDSIPNRYISSSSLANKKLKVGDIVIEKSGGSPTQSTGRTCYISEDLIKEKKDVVCSNFCAAFSIREAWDYKYIYYYIQNIYNQGNFFNFEGKTSGIRNLLLDTAFKSIPLPPIDKTIQTKLSGILDCLDQKISLNTRMNAELEAMAKQLYDYWFVQFDFPFDFAQGKPDENGKPYKSSGGKMVWNDDLKRSIPEGWTYSTIQEIENKIITGKTPATADETNFGGDIPFITIDDIRKSLFVYTTERTLSKRGAESQNNKYIPKGTLCCSCIGTTGIIGYAGKESQTNQQINSIVITNDYYREFLLFSLRLFFQYAKAKTGNILPNMNKEEFSAIKTVRPTLNVLENYHNVVAPLFLQIDNNIQELNSLSKQRDELLPMLMNGQVEVSGLIK